MKEVVFAVILVMQVEFALITLTKLTADTTFLIVNIQISDE